MLSLIQSCTLLNFLGVFAQDLENALLVLVEASINLLYYLFFFQGLSHPLQTEHRRSFGLLHLDVIKKRTRLIIK